MEKKWSENSIKKLMCSLPKIFYHLSRLETSCENLYWCKLDNSLAIYLICDVLRVKK